MTKPAAHADPNSGLLKNEPILVGHAAGWLVLQLGVLLVSRYHLVTAGQWSALSIELTGVITAVLLAASAWVIRRVVAPAWKLAESEAARLGVTVPDWLGLSTAVGTLGGSSIYPAGQPPSDDDSAPAGDADTQARTAADILAEADAIHPEQTPTPDSPAYPSPPGYTEAVTA